MTEHVELPADGIVAFCERWRVSELAPFGSVVRDDFGPKSDVDLLVTAIARRCLNRIPDSFRLIMAGCPVLFTLLSTAGNSSTPDAVVFRERRAHHRQTLA